MISKLRGRESTKRRDEAGDEGSADRGNRRRSVAAALKGGLVGTVVMTLFRMPISDSLPPTARFYAKYVGSGDPDDYPVRALALHLLYGAVGGLFFGLLPIVDGSGTERENERRATVAGAVYALALSVFGDRVILRGLLDMDPEPDERFIFHVGHLIYGLTLGALYGSEMSRGDRDGD